MDMSLGYAFIAGILSFVSPCVLPLIPAYLSFISGAAVSELAKQDRPKEVMLKALTNTLFFVLGFTIVFVLLGASASAVGTVLKKYMKYILIGGGAVIIVLALHLLGIFRIKALDVERRVQVKDKKFGLLGSVAVGMAFAAGWTPCIGPILVAILGVAATKETVLQGIALLTAYSLGIGIPFILASLSVNAFLTVFRKIKKAYRAIEVVAGFILVFAGAWMILSGFRTPVGVDYEDLTFAGFDGREISITEFAGEPLVVSFWATFCKPCRAELAELAEIYRSQQGEFNVLAVCLDREGDKPRNYARDLGLPFVLAFGSNEDIQAFGLRPAMPTIVVLNPKQNIVATFTGFDRKRFLKALEKAKNAG